MVVRGPPWTVRDDYDDDEWKEERNEKRLCAGAKTEYCTLHRAVRNRPLAVFTPTRRNNSRFTRNTMMMAVN